MHIHRDMDSTENSRNGANIILNWHTRIQNLAKNFPPHIYRFQRKYRMSFTGQTENLPFPAKFQLIAPKIITVQRTEGNVQLTWTLARDVTRRGARITVPLLYSA